MPGFGWDTVSRSVSAGVTARHTARIRGAAPSATARSGPRLFPICSG
jgi:hypothetical protein